MSLVQTPRLPLLKMLTVGLLPSQLKVWWYRLRGGKIGSRVSIGFLSVVVAESIEIGEGTTIGFATILRGRKIVLKRHVRIGSMTFFDVESVFVDDDAKINEQVFAGGPMLPESHLHIGKNAIIMQYTFLNPTKPLIIGDGTGVGGHCLLFTHGSWQSRLEGYPVAFAPITLGKNVWLPWRVFILPGVSIGDGTTIGAGSLVTQSLPERCLAAGVPAKILRREPEYPARLTIEQKRLEVSTMLGEFARYLEHHGYAVTSDSTDHGQCWKISGNKRPGMTLVVFDRARVDAATLAIPAGDCCLLFLFGVNGGHDPRPNLLWADIESGLRTGTSEIGEETISYLSRFGVRFYRKD